MTNTPQVTHFFINAYCAKCKAQLYSDGEAAYCPFCGVIAMPEARDCPPDAPPLFYPKPPEAATPDGVTLLHKTLGIEGEA